MHRGGGGLSRALSKFAPVATLVCVFIASRAYAYGSGLRFDARRWERFWHFVDPALLVHQLGECLWYLHGQPPLFSAWLGLYLKLFGSAFDGAFMATFIAMGLLIGHQTFVLARHAGLSSWLSVFVSCALITSPAALLFENFLFYTYPEALLLLCATNLAIGAVQRPSGWRFCGLTSALCALTLTRSLFHPIWIVMVLAVVYLSTGRAQLRALALGSALPLVVVCLVMGKSLALYGTSSLSSWRGMNLARVVVDRMPKELRRDWVQKAILSPVSEVGAFQALADYQDKAREPGPTGIAMLDEPSKSNGAMNFHHIAYVDISRMLERDALTVIRRRPDLYLKSVFRNLKATFEPSWRYVALRPSAVHLARYTTIWQTMFGLARPGSEKTSLGWMLATPFVLMLTLRRLRQTLTSRSEASFVTASLCTLHVLYVIGVGALMERSENQRFRFDIDPFLAVLTLLVLRDLVETVRTRLRPSVSS